MTNITIEVGDLQDQATTTYYTLTGIINTNIQIKKVLSEVIDLIIDVKDKNTSLYNSYINGASGKQWKDCEFHPIRIKSGSTYLFIGRIKDHNFMHNKMTLFLESESGRLSDQPLNPTTAQFIKDVGKVKTSPPYAASDYKVELCVNDDAESPFGWTAGSFIKSGRDWGLLITDNTTIPEESWSCYDLTVTGEDTSVETLANMVTEGDNLEVSANDTSVPKDLIFEMKFGAVGEKIAAASYIQSIEINYNVALYVQLYQLTELQIYNYSTTNWDNIKYIAQFNLSPAKTYKKGTVDIVLEHDDIKKYFLDSSGFYDLKLRWVATAATGGETRMYIDYINVKVIHSTANITSVMIPIIDNGDEWVEVENTLNLTTIGVTADDLFLIGENTGQVLQDALPLAVNTDPNFNRYIARNYIGQTPMNILTSVCQLEDAYWWEEYDSAGNVTIVVKKRTSFSLLFLPTVTYDYESQTVGQNPTSWTVTNAPVTIQAEGTHAKAIRGDAATDGAFSALWTIGDNELESDYDYVEFEALVKTGTNTTDDNYITFSNTAGQTLARIILKQSVDEIIGTTTTLITPIVLDNWYKFKLIFNFTASTVDIYVDDILIKSGEAFTNAGTKMARITTSCGGGSGNDYFFLDNFKFTKVKPTIDQSIHNWGFNLLEKSNQYKSHRLLGNPNYAIDNIVIDPDETNTSPLQWLTSDISISTVSDAKIVGQNILNRLKIKRPSYTIIIDDDSSFDYQIGYTIPATFVRPTIAKTTYPIRSVIYNISYPIGKKSVEIVLGFGETKPQDKLVILLDRIEKLAWRTQLDGMNPIATIGVPAFSHPSLTGITASQHHTKYTDAEVQALSINNVVEDVTPQLGAALDAQTFKITGMGDPTAAQDAATKMYVDDAIANASGKTFYLETTVSDVAGYELLEETYSNAAAQSWSVTGGATAIEEFITPSGGLGITFIEGSIWEIHIHAAKTAGIKTATLSCGIYKSVSPYAGGDETLLATSEATGLLGAVSAYTLHATIPDTVMGVTDRIVYKFYITIGGAGTEPTVLLYAQSGYNSHVKIAGGDFAQTYLTASSISDTAYAASWDTVTTIAPSKNAVYDAIEGLSVGYASVNSYATIDKNDAQSIPNSTATICKYDDIIKNIGSDYDNTTWLYTCPVDGVYHIDARWLYEDNSWVTSEVAALYLYVNGSEVKTLQYIEQDTTNTKYQSLQGSVDIYCTAGQTLAVWTYQNTGGAVTNFPGATHNWVNYRLVKQTNIGLVDASVNSYAVVNEATAQSVGHNAFEKLEYADVEINEGSDYDAATFIYTCPVDGVYHVDAAVHFVNHAWVSGDSIILTLFSTDTQIRWLTRHTFSGSISELFGAQGSCDVYCSAGDLLNVRVYQYNGGAHAINTYTVDDSNYVNYRLVKQDAVGLIDEDDMVSDSTSQAPSQQSVKAYVDAGKDFNLQFEGFDGFTTSQDAGLAQIVLFTDVDAGILANGFAPHSGTYRLKIGYGNYSGNPANDIDVTIYATNLPAGAFSWNLESAYAFQITKPAGLVTYYTLARDWTIVKGQNIGIYLHKTDNCDGNAGALSIRSIGLVRQ